MRYAGQHHHAHWMSLRNGGRCPVTGHLGAMDPAAHLQVRGAAGNAGGQDAAAASGSQQKLYLGLQVGQQVLNESHMPMHIRPCLRTQGAEPRESDVHRHHHCKQVQSSPTCSSKPSLVRCSGHAMIPAAAVLP